MLYGLIDKYQDSLISACTYSSSLNSLSNYSKTSEMSSKPIKVSGTNFKTYSLVYWALAYSEFLRQSLIDFRR